jgi:hypothetical protein
MNKNKLLAYIDSIDSIGNPFGKRQGNLFSASCIRFKYFTISNDDICVYETGDEIIISINGSDDLIEWVNNARLYPIVHNCHNDYYTKAELYLNTIKVVLDDWYKETCKPIVFTGHSRGGAIVQVMCDMYKNNSSCVTFGSPRVFTLKGSKACTFKHTRVYSSFDLVRHMPFCWLFPFFKHYQTTTINIKNRIMFKFSHTNYKLLIDKFIK